MYLFLAKLVNEKPEVIPYLIEKNIVGRIMDIFWNDGDPNPNPYRNLSDLGLY